MTKCYLGPVSYNNLPNSFAVRPTLIGIFGLKLDTDVYEICPFCRLHYLNYFAQKQLSLTTFAEQKPNPSLLK